MIKNIFAALAVVAMLSSCHSKTALNYNQDFVAKEKALTPDMEKTETDVARFAQTQQWDSVSAVAGRMKSKIEAQIADIKKTPAPDAKGGEKFKAAVVEYFDYVRGLYVAYQTVADAKTPEDRMTEVAKMQELVTHKEAVGAKIREEQQEYAKANNFRIEKY